jgi:S1-C subfamily serine protease
MTQRDFWKIVLASSFISAGLVLFFTQWPSPPPTLAEFRQLNTRVFDTPLSEDERVNIELYQTLSPGVVNITSTTVSFNFWLEPIPSRGVGSGFFVDNEGHIVTNYHVIQDAERLDVTLRDRSTYRARVVGADPLNDVALLKIDCPQQECLPLQLGDSGSLKIGQKVLAIGNPFGLSMTLTTGIISSLGRTIESRGGIIEEVIQTDAAINPGNSGGPLLNTRGEVIGINTAIISRTGENVGIGFAVPVNTLRRVVPDLMQHGRVLRPWFGVQGRPLTRRLASALREARLEVPVDGGFLIEQVERGSSADRAGLRGGRERVFFGNFPLLTGGDILVSLAGRNIAASADILAALENRRPGEEVDIVYYRGNRRIEQRIELAGRDRTGVFRF